MADEHQGGRSAPIDGLDTFWREAPSRAADPVLYVHGVPTSADLWRPFLARTGGVAPDLPGFGRSAKPPGFDNSIDGYASWLERFVDALGLARFALVAHDWGGGLALALAQRRPAAVARLCIVDAVPLLPGYRWHRVARIWRTPVAGELAMGFTTRAVMRRGARGAFVPPRPMPDELLEAAWPHFDQGTMRSILRLYRSSPPAALAAAGARLGELRCPALVVWGAQDPFLPPRFAHAYAEALGGEARVEVLDGAGHWPWLDRPEALDAITSFALGDGARAAAGH